MPAVVPLIVAGASIYAAHKQASAAKDAAETQSAATDRALVAQREANQPYMQLGQLGVNRLMQTPQQAYTQTFTGPGGSNGAQAFQVPPQGPPPPPQGNLASLGRPRNGAPMSGTAEPRGQIGPQAGQMVQMRAPDGSVRPVPAAMVQQLEARGAQRVG